MATILRASAKPAEGEAPETAAPQDLRDALGEPWASRAGGRDWVADTLRGQMRALAWAGVATVGRTPLLKPLLHGPLPDAQVLMAADFVPGRVATANALFTGIYSFAGATVRTSGRAPWRAQPPSEAWTEALHEFSWLRHYRAAGGETATSQARALVTGWLEEAGTWHPIAWRPHVVARRLMAWLANGRLLWEGSDVVWRHAVLRHLARQARFLQRTARLAPDGLPRMATAVGLTMSGICLSDGALRRERGLLLLAREIERQVLPDGGHVSRNPAALLTVFADLLALKATLETASYPVPKLLSDAVDRMAPMIRFFRLGDGRLSLFNGADEGSQSFADSLLAKANQAGGPLRHARHSGYARLEAARTVVVADVGAAPRGRYAGALYAGVLAFEMSVGAHRVIVNCGPAGERGPEWRQVARATAAHSTLVAADHSSATFQGMGPLGERPVDGPRTVRSACEDSPQGTWLVASHDGYSNAYQLIHERRLYLAPSGEDLRGEDRLAADPRQPAPTASSPFALRFHLHPDIRASLARDGQSVLLMLPNGDGWRFRASGGVLGLEPSIYLGRGTEGRKSEQIVVSGETAPRKHQGRGQAADLMLAQVKWALVRLNSKGTSPKAAE